MVAFSFFSTGLRKTLVAVFLSNASISFVSVFRPENLLLASKDDDTNIKIGEIFDDLDIVKSFQ
jgi:hypothetical protein